MAVVMDYYHGDCHIKVLDDAYRNKSREEIKALKEEAIKVCREVYIARLMRELEEAEDEKLNGGKQIGE